MNRTTATLPYNNDNFQKIIQFPHLIANIAGKHQHGLMHSDWIHYLFDHDEKQQEKSLQAHRGSYKTTAIAVGMVYDLLLFPNNRILYFRKKAEKAQDVVNLAYQILMLPEIQQLFYFAHGKWPKAVIKRKAQITFNFKNDYSVEGNLNPFGLDSSYTGVHGDKAILDDFVTIDDRISKAERERTKILITEIRTNIIDPGKPVRFVGTPWHRDDAWIICPEPLKYDIHRTGLISPEELKKLRDKTPQAVFAANYLLKHTSDEGALFVNPQYGKWQRTGVGYLRGHLDAAYDGDHYNAITVMARRNDGFVQAVGTVLEGNVKNLIVEITSFFRKYGCTRIYNESNPDKGFTADLLRERGFSVTAYPESMNKDVKISTYLVDMWNEMIWSDETDGMYMTQILDYREKQEPNDAPDSAASLVKYCFNKRGFGQRNRWSW